MEAKKVIAASLIVVAVAGTAIFIAAGSRQGDPLEQNLYFVIYGQDWCPHCQAEMRFLNSTFGSDRVEFRDLDNAEYQAEFLRAITELNKLGIPAGPYFPLTGIHVNGRLVAVVQGEISSPDYLRSVLENTEKGRILVVLGGQGYSIPPNQVLEDVFQPNR